MIDRKIATAFAEKLVGQMTLEEKAAQLKFDAPAIPRLGVPAYNWWNEALHGVARAGTATVFPQAIGLAAAFDEELHQKIAETIAHEGRAKYNGQSAEGDRDIYKGLTFWSPNINIFRDPRWGRGHETYGEDPYLTGRLGVRFIKGLQGDGKYLKSAACAKHFAVHSGPEAIRHEFDAQANQKDLWETYLPAFEDAVKEAGVEAVMGAYNRVNGEPACGSKTLLVDILREKWGFEGHVTSDCWAIADFHLHHMVTATAPESAALALKMGCDTNCGVTYIHLLEAYKEGLITEEDIDKAAIRLFTSRYMLGLFSDDCEYDKIPYTDCDTDENDELAKLAAERTMVLLKNNGVLPLDPGKVKTIAVVGPNADSILALKGNYYGTSSRQVTFLAGLRAYCKEHGIRVLYSQGSPMVGDRAEMLAKGKDRLAEARLCAANADVVIACVGLDETLEGEEGDQGNYSASGDKISLNLPECQIQLLDTLASVGKPMVTVLAVGSSLNVPQGDAQLLTWYPGQAGGTVLAEILFGEKAPCGHLPVTFYEGLDDLPEFTDYSMTNRTYRYFEGKPLYPFGYGLSYTRFEATAAEVDAAAKEAKVTIRNAGDRAGIALAQVYIHADESADATPNPRLIGFKNVELQPGEEKVVTVTLDRNAFTVINDEGERVSGGSTYTVYAGISQPDQRSAELLDTVPVKVRVTL